MEAIQLKQVIAKDGEVLLTGLPFKRGQAIEIIVFAPPKIFPSRSRLTVSQLRRSSLIGMWQDRDDIEDSSSYARKLRDEAQHRGGGPY